MNEFPINKHALDDRQRRKQLDRYYEQVQNIILARQDPITGLLPANTAVAVHGDHTHVWVRDNVYSILAVWGLALAYRRQNHDEGKRYLLEQSVVKLMRSLMIAMMKQATQVEYFKQARNPLGMLFPPSDSRIANPVMDEEEWGHLQLDATSLFLLMLAQMTASGLRIVFTLDEVDFIQNLVYYLGRSYRIPDYGIWERGHKMSEGIAEIHASSVGMAKAALEALQGFDLFGAYGGPVSVVHVMADDIARARHTLETLLPRESNSKETDAALLSIIGYPAFAVEDPALIERTRNEVIGKLQGRYGCKRFLRDGHQTALEDHREFHDEVKQSSQFEHIEPEWPLFFAYLLLDGVFSGDLEQARNYQERLESLTVEQNGQRLIPELYYVPLSRVELEKAQPQSQERMPNQNIPLIWAQSLYMLGVLLQGRFIHPYDLDPLGRCWRVGRHRDKCVQVVLLSASAEIQLQLQAQGIATQTPEQILPVELHPATDLEMILCELGRNRTLGLSGRPPGWLGSLASSQVFIRGEGKTVVFTPPFLNQSNFYLSLDNYWLQKRLRAELVYIDHHWDQPGQPLMVLVITEAMLKADDHDVLLSLLRDLQGELCNGVSIRSAKLAELLPTAGWKRMDFYDRPAQADIVQNDDGDRIFHWQQADIRPLSTVETSAWRQEPDDRRLLQQFNNSGNPYEQVELLMLLWERLGPDFVVEALSCTIRQLTERVYGKASEKRLWGVIRRAAGRLEKVDETLEEAVAEILMRQHRVSVGRAYSHQAIIVRPIGNAEIMDRIRAYGGDDPRGQILIQEIVLLLGMLIKTEPGLFKDTLTIRPWCLLVSMTACLAEEQEMTRGEALNRLLEFSPHAFLSRLHQVILEGDQANDHWISLACLRYEGDMDNLRQMHFPANDELTLVGSDVWSAWREIYGVLSWLPENFYPQVWEILQHCRGLIIGDQLDARNRLDSELVRTDMTPTDSHFAVQVEHLLNNIHAPEYRQLTIEALLTLSDIFKANPNLRIHDDLVLDILIGTAVYLYWQEARETSVRKDYNEHCAEAWSAFYASPQHRVANAIAVALRYLLEVAERKKSNSTITPSSPRSVNCPPIDSSSRSK